MAVLAPTAALADDESATDDVDTSESTTTVPAVETTTTPPVDDPAPAEDPVLEQEGGQEETSGDDSTEDEQDVVEDAEDAESVEDEQDLADDQPQVEALAEADAEEELIVPDTGLGKTSQPIRIGVDLAEGTYVPAGVTTAGSVLQITETGPDVEGGSATTECTTEAGTAEGTATFCVFDQAETPVLELSEGRLSPLSVVFPENPDPTQDDQVYLAERTSTVTVTQIGTQPGLVSDPESATVAPCGEETELVEVLPGLEIPIPVPCTRQVALLEDTGLPPVAADDRATTREDTPVAIDVLANDDTVAGAPLTGLDFASAPGNGSVEIVGTDAAPQVRYTPDAGFSGTDTFTYGLSTPNGTAFAEVTVVVVPDPEPASNDQVAPATVSGLPDAGGPGLSMLGWAAALLASGAGLLTIGRRRRATS